MTAVDPNGSGALVVPGPSLPLASGANEVPLSTGAGRVYVAASLLGLLGGGVPWDVASSPESITTLNATPTTVVTLDASTWAGATVYVRANATLGDASLGCGWDVMCHVLNASGTVTLSSLQARRTNSVAPADAWEVSLVVSGTDVLVQVTGAAATTINWTVATTVVGGA